MQNTKAKPVLGGTYGYSSIDFDSSTNKVTAYATTEMDGTLLPYYEPALTVSINELNRKQDEASSCQKIDAKAVLCEFPGKASDYSIFSEHGVSLMVQDSRSGLWVDPVAYEYVASLDIAQAFEMQFMGQGPPQSISEHAFSLGVTFARSGW